MPIDFSSLVDCRLNSFELKVLEKIQESLGADVSGESLMVEKLETYFQLVNLIRSPNNELGTQLNKRIVDIMRSAPYSDDLRIQKHL